MRAFISLDFPENAVKEIQAIQSKLPAFNGRLIEKENLHLTLKFLGKIDEKMLEKINSLLSGIKFPAMNLSFGEIGTFDYKGTPKIVWLKISGADKLQGEIDKALEELFLPEKRFMSHLTIARIKQIKSKEEFQKAIADIKYNKLGFKANSFALKESVLTKQKPAYKILKNYKSI